MSRDADISDRIRRVWELVGAVPAGGRFEAVLAAARAGEPWQIAHLDALQELGRGATLDAREDRAGVEAAVRRLVPGAGFVFVQRPGPDEGLYEHLDHAAGSLRAQGHYLLMWGPPMDAIAFVVVPEAAVRELFQLCLELRLYPTAPQPPPRPLPPAEAGDARDAGLVVERAWQLYFAIDFRLLRSQDDRDMVRCVGPSRERLAMAKSCMQQLRALDPRGPQASYGGASIDVGDSLHAQKLLFELRLAVAWMEDVLTRYTAGRAEHAVLALDKNNLKSPPRGLRRLTALRLLSVTDTALGEPAMAKIRATLPPCAVLR